MAVVARRESGQAVNIRDLVQPLDGQVQQLAASLGPDFVLSCLQWVRGNIRYVPQGHFDFWQLPGETLAGLAGDCEDAAILLCSLLRTRLSADEVFVTAGWFAGQGHAWVYCQGVVLEAVADGGAGVYLEVDPYVPYVRFNDRLYRRA